MNTQILVICATVYFISVCYECKNLNNRLESRTGKSVQTGDLTSENNNFEANSDGSRKSEKQTSTFIAGVLNSFDNVTYWAELEEKIFKFAKIKHRRLREEIRILKRFLRYTVSSLECLPYAKGCLRYPNMKTGLTASKRLVRNGMGEICAQAALQLLHKILPFIRLDTNFYETIPEKYSLNWDQNNSKLPGVNLTLFVPCWPNWSDLQLAMHSLLHIQEVYNYDYNNLPSVLSPETNKPPQLDAFHCAKIGNYALHAKYYAMAIEWIEHAFEMANKNPEDAYSLELLESYLEIAIEVHNEMLATVQASESHNMKDIFEDFVTHTAVASPKRKRRSTTQGKTHGMLKKLNIEAESKFNDICKGEYHRIAKERAELYCWYDKNSSPARTISPYKKELISLEPEVIQVYEILGDKLISSLVKHKNKCSWIAGNEETQSFAQRISTRTASRCWSEAPELESLLTKVSSLTHANVRGNELEILTNIIDYLSGRFHRVHIDTLPLKDNDYFDLEKDDGNSLMSLIFFFNDVHTGGLTAFPPAGTSALPIKGSVIYWLNKYRNGSTRYTSWHGGCPVIYGHKQALVIGVYTKPQFLTYPCTLNRNE